MGRLVHLRWAAGVALFFLALWSILTHGRVGSWNDASRLATAEALVHHGTWVIDETAMGELTKDRVYLDGHFYSSKPPVLSFLVSGVYALLYHGLGLSLNPELCKAESDPCYCLALPCPRQADWAYYVITLTIVGVSSVLLIAVFYLVTVALGRSRLLSLSLTVLLGLGTLVTPYSLVLNNHVPAAACLMVAFYALLRARGGGPAMSPGCSASTWLLVAGLTAALAFTIDLGTIFFLCAFAGLALQRHRLRSWPFLLGSLLPLILLVALDWWSLGDPLPPNMHPAGYNYTGSPFAAVPAGTERAGNVPRHAFRMLVGDHGMFALSPVLLWAVVGLGRLWVDRHHPLRGEAIAIGSAIALTLVSYVTFTDHFGGIAYGVRWFVPLTPLLLVFAAQPRLCRSHPSRALLSVAALLSLIGGWRGALNPWKPALPPLRLEYATPTAGRYVASLPEETIVYTTPPQVRQLPLSPRPIWRAHLREYLATDDSLPIGVSGRPVAYVLGQYDRAAAELLQATLPRGRWATVGDGLAVYSVPAVGNHPSPEVPLQARFAEKIELFGADLSSSTLRPGDDLAIWLYWRTLAPMDVGYTAFVHLVGPHNLSTEASLWAQSDRLPGYPLYLSNRWFPGEVVMGRLAFRIPLNAPPGDYALVSGLYDSTSMRRLPRSDAAGDTETIAIVTVEP